MNREYKIFIDSVDYTNYLQLPFSINIRSDESYDTASVVLSRTNIKKPFSPYTPITIKISDTIDFEDNYYMIVEEDKVDEYYVGPKVFYKHNITCIERTKILDGISVPSFSITNPASGEIVETFSTLYNRWEKLTNDISGSGLTGYGSSRNQLDGYSLIVHGNWEEGGDNIGDFVNHSKYSAEIGIGWRSYFSITGRNFPATIPNNTEIELPKPLTTTNPYAYQGVFLGVYNIVWVSDKRVGIDYAENLIPPVTCEYYTKKGNTETIIGRVLMDPVAGTISIIQKGDSSFRNVGSQLYYTPPANETVTLGCRILKPGYYTDNLFENFKDKVKNDIIECFSRTMQYVDDTDQLDWETFAKWVSPNSTKAETCNSFGKKALERSNYYSQTALSARDATFERNITSISVDSDFNINRSSSYKTISNVLEKLVNMIEPAYGTFSFSVPDKIGDIIVSERIYDKKTVSEILFDLAKLANAYPELDDNNTIVFVEPSPVDNPLFEDKTEGTSFTLNTDNAVTTYVSDIKNVVTTPVSNRESYSYWPDRYNFAYPNGLGDSYLTTPDTSAITISNSDGIYYLKKIEVCNCCKTGTFITGNGEITLNSDSIIDITPFTYEKKYYNTLYNTQNNISGVTNFSKDNCIFWTKGSNEITLDELESDTKTAFFGDSAPTTYKIQNAIVNAIKNKYGIIDFSKTNLESNPTSYRYRITYIDNASVRIKTEKFNPTYQLPLAATYNQTSNTISGNEWGNGAQIDILRRGSLDRSKEIYIRNLSKLPTLGDILSEGEENYVADNINFLFHNRFVNCVVSYTKDFNKINKDISISKEYRQYEIYDENIIDRYVNIDRYAYIGDEPEIEGTNESFFFSQLTVGRETIPSLAVVFFKDKEKNLIKYTKISDDGSISEETTGGFLMPLTYISSGNSFVLKTAARDNYAIAYRPDLSSDVRYEDILGNLVTSGARLNKDARYVDDLGEAAFMSVYILSERAVADFYNRETFPEISASEGSVFLRSLGYQKDIPINKDNRERICITYQQHYISNRDDLKWNPGLIKYILDDSTSVRDKILMNDATETYDEDLKPTYYGVSYDIMNSVTINLENKIMIPTIDVEGGKIVGKGDFTAKQPIRSIVLAYPKTGEAIFHISTNIKEGETFEIPDIFCRNFFNKYSEIT